MNVKINREANGQQHQTVNFSDQTEQWIYSVDNQLDSVHKTVDSDDADLNNFFSRPIKIDSINWTVGSMFNTTINPWQLYFENPRVINRITNYNVLRAKLCVRIMINGNGFHYGRALASYRPLHNQDSMVSWRMGLISQDVIGASQRMHVWIDPTKSQGGTLCLPYVYYKNGLNIPEMDWRDMGELDIASLTTLNHANLGTDNVTLSVFAWAEDVHMSIPTLAEPGALLPQSVLEEHSEADAMSKGPISDPAASVAKVAGALSKVPAIGGMARATQLAASTTATVARAFGMSKPTDTGPIQSFKPTYVGNLANTNVLDTSTKLTYDVRQETTIDPSAVGLGPADEMTISSIASRESYLTQFSWATTDTPESLLWNCYVTPHMHDVSSTSGKTEYHMTPMAFAAMPFHNWRGTIKFRFQIVASAFHKGRIKVVYDPYFAAAGNSEYNVQYTQVIDLASERDFEVEVNWGQERSYLVHPGFNAGKPFSTDPLSVDNHGFANGMLSIFVVNDLTTPSSNVDDLPILVSVAAGDNFEVVNPTTALTDFSYYQPQSVGADTIPFLKRAAILGLVMPAFYVDPISGHQYSLSNSSRSSFGGMMHANRTMSMISKSSRHSRPPDCLEEHSTLADADGTTDESTPVVENVDSSLGTIGVDTANDAQLIYFGDPITSIRQLLKRYEHYSAWTAVSAEFLVQNFVLPDFPMYRGYAGSGAISNAQVPVDPTPFNYCNGTLMNWFTPAFLARRGGIRHKYVLTRSGVNRCGLPPASVMSVSRLANPSGYSLTTNETTTTVSTSANTYLSMNRGINGHSGMQATHVVNNPVLEIELPYHSEFRFMPARTKNFNGANDLFNKFHYLRYTHAEAVAVLDYVAAGEDFSLSFFQAVPVMWNVPNPDPSITD